MLLYTFRTNKKIIQFLEAGNLSLSHSVFTVVKPNEDIPKLLSLISDMNPDWVIGFASVNSSKSGWESFAINRFGRGRVSTALPIDTKLKLARPGFLGKLSDVPIREGMSASFCNQAAFKVQEFIGANRLEVKSCFFHISKSITNA